jgi:hypothetical protein
MDLNETLIARGSVHGKFEEHASCAQKLKQRIRACLVEFGKPPDHLTDLQQEALDMICHKIGRIVAGDPSHTDHWHDIAGYATLAERATHDANL